MPTAAPSTGSWLTHPPAAGLEVAAELLRALASPHRLAIVRELDGRARCVHELVEARGVSQPLVSQHLRVLRASDLVSAERRGREIAYALADHHVTHIVEDAVAHVGEGLTGAEEQPA